MRQEVSQMTLRYVYGALTAVVFACGVVTVEPAHAQLRDGGLLPQEESGLVTAVGCFLRGGDDGEEYVLARPARGPVNSVPEERCTAGANDNALRLKHTSDFGMNDAMLGRWIEINGRLEKETSDDPDNLRELYVRSFRILPVVPPRASVAPSPTVEPAPPVYEQQPIAQAPPETPAPIATTGESLPQTASYVPASGLLGLLSLAGVFGLRSFRSRQRR
jgi:hypothetical protein